MVHIIGESHLTFYLPPLQLILIRLNLSNLILRIKRVDTNLSNYYVQWRSMGYIEGRDKVKVMK